MEFIAGKLNNKWLENILNASAEADWVKAAIAYASGDPKLIKFCFDKNIRLQYWGRYDPSVPVDTSILQKFLKKKSPNYVCKLVPDIFHPKIIWWGGYGAYIGSANLTDRAWYGNIECGIFITESELISTGIDLELETFFERIDDYSSPVTQEIIDELDEFSRKQQALLDQLDNLKEQIESTRSISRIKSLINVDKKKTEDRLKTNFLKEWNGTLQILRDISNHISEPINLPRWVASETAKGIQADQFLHAYYYSYVRDGQTYPYQKLFEQHKNDPQSAVETAIDWWRNLQEPPTTEGVIINEWAPFNYEKLALENLKTITLKDFIQVCERVHAVRDHSLRVNNETYGLPKDTGPKGQEQCINLLATYLWKQKSASGKSVVDVIFHVLYGGSDKDIPLRLWEATREEKWRIPHLGISTLGELVGWAKPDVFPPRNGRTSKALTALGYQVKIHSG